MTEVDIASWMKGRKARKTMLAELESRTSHVRDMLTAYVIDDYAHAVAKWTYQHKVEKGHWNYWELAWETRPAPPPPKAPPAPPLPLVDNEHVDKMRQEVLPELLDRTTWLRRSIDEFMDRFFLSTKRKLEAGMKVSYGYQDKLELTGRIEHTNRGWIVNRNYSVVRDFKNQGLVCKRKLPYAQK